MDISIPTGAIESLGFSNESSICLSISIPTGAIESPVGFTSLFDLLFKFQYRQVRLNHVSTANVVALVFKFQYRQVRLNLATTTATHPVIQISIPTGAIKSKRLDSVGSVYKVFQYRQVRLNPYYVDHPTGQCFISIPTGAIESQRLRPRCGAGSEISIPTGAIESRAF